MADCTGIQVQPNCCCVVGEYDCGVPDCFGNGIDLFADFTQLSRCRMVFIGVWNNPCDQVRSYPAPVQVALKAWVEAGGRLVVVGSALDCFDFPDPDNSTRYNNLLGFLGTGMQLTPNIPIGCPADADCHTATKEAVGVMNGIVAPFTYRRAGEISGGTPFAKTAIDAAPCDVGYVMLAGEAIGTGIVVASASSFIASSCAPQQNCQFFERLCNWEIARILGP